MKHACTFETIQCREIMHICKIIYYIYRIYYYITLYDIETKICILISKTQNKEGNLDY